MNLIDRIKNLLSGKTPATVAELLADMNLVESELLSAERGAAEARQKHDDAVLDRLAKGETAAGSKSRDAVLLADDRVGELRGAMRALQARLASARLTEDLDAKQRDLERLQAVLARRTAAAEQLNATIETFAAQFNEVLNLGIEAWGMLNPRPPSIFQTIAVGDLATRVLMRLYGVSDGRIGVGHLPAAVCLQRVNIIDDCDMAALRMMTFATGPVPEIKEAA